MSWILPMMFLMGPTEPEASFSKPVNIVIADGEDSAYLHPINRVQNLDVSADVTYEEILDEAIYNCKNAKPEKVNVPLLKKLVEVEKKYKVPASLRGMLLAAACHESGYNPKKKGDRKFSKKRKPKAIGLFQMWPWWESKKWGYGIDRTNPDVAAEAYMRHVTRQLKKVKKKCKIRNNKRKWLTAWATAIRAPKKGGRCGERPLFYKRVLKKWHRSIRNIRKEVEECAY